MNQTVGTIYWDKEEKQKKCETPYLNGRKHGVERAWYENGSLDHEICFVNGFRHGFSRTFFHDEQFISETFFKNNSLHGLAHRVNWDVMFQSYLYCIRSFVNGKIKLEIEHIRTGLLHEEKKRLPENKILFNKKQWKLLCDKPL